MMPNNECDLTDNDLGEEQARMISEILKRNSTLTKLNLARDYNWKLSERIKWNEHEQTTISATKERGWWAKHW